MNPSRLSPGQSLLLNSTSVLVIPRLITSLNTLGPLKIRWSVFKVQFQSLAARWALKRTVSIAARQSQGESNEDKQGSVG